MGIVEVIIGIAAVIVLIFVGALIGIETEKAKCYHETTEMIKHCNKAMPEIMKWYEDMMNMMKVNQ